jgi:hypothetical protein
MKRFLFVILVLIAIGLSACMPPPAQDVIPDTTPAPVVDTTPVQTPPAEPSCDCTDEFEPVCANGQLINNKCTADCLGITGYVKGECHDTTGKTIFPCAPTSGGLSAQHNPVCARVIEVDTGVRYWKTYPNAMTACQVDKAGKLDVKEFTRGECGT